MFVTITVQCMCVRVCVRACVSPLEFVWPLTSNILYGFQNNATQLFAITCRSAICNVCSGRPKVKVILEGQIFVWTITPTILDGFQYKFAQLFSIMSRCAISITNRCAIIKHLFRYGQGQVGSTCT